MERRQRRVGAKALLFWQRSNPSDLIDSAPSKTHGRGHHIALLLSGALLFTLAVVWLSGIFAFQKIQVGSRHIDAQSSPKAIASIVSEQAANYKLTIVAANDQKTSYSLDEMGLAVDESKTVEVLQKQANDSAARLVWWQPKKANVELKTDQAKFQTFLQKHTRIEITPVKNALLSVSPEGKVETSKESIGEEYGLEGGQNTIIATASNLQIEPIVMRKRTVQPTITESSMQKTKEQLEKVLLQTISFKLESKLITATPKDIAAWLTISPNEQEKDYELTVDQKKVEDYINKVAASNFRRPRDQYEVVNKDGSKFIVTKGINGLDITNKDEATKAIAAKVLSGEGFTQDFAVAITPFKTTAVQAGPKRIEVNITTKRMYAFENDVLLKTFLVSAGAPDTPTVTGNFTIFSKVRKQDMRGFNADGSRYFQPNVQWVNYFYRDYAIHGNYWRPLSYFGNVNSSHGCVGLVNSEAEWLYNWAPAGTPVFVHT